MVLAQAVLAQQAVIPDIEWSVLWPFTILALAGVILITITSLVPITRTNSFPAAFTAACGILAGASVIYVVDRVNELPAAERAFHVVADSIVIDNFTMFITMIICICVVLAAFLLDDYLRREGLDGPEWYALLLLSASGGILLASAEDLIVTFVGLEILSIAVYVLAALHLRRTESQEAGFKYFVLGALSSAVFLYGIALVYGATGSTRLSAISGALFRPGVNGELPAEGSSLLLVGMGFLLVGFGFKVSAVPFHVWTPDVYQGSPTPVVAFMASAVKVAAFGGFLRVFIYAFSEMSEEWLPVIAALAIVTLLVGSFLAVVQTDVKRMMAYSSIAHVGFMLIGLHSATQDVGTDILGSSAILFYLFTYSFTVIGVFAVITVVGRTGDADHAVESYRGLARRQPLMAGLFAVLLFAQAGVPFTSGFWAKVRVILAATSDQSWWLAGIAMLSAAVAAYLYLRVVVNMYMADDESEVTDDDDAPVRAELVVPPAVLTVLAISAIVTIAFGVLPDIGRGFLQDAAATLTLLRP